MKVDESSLIKRILELVVDFPRFGYRRITRLLRSEGWRVNAKHVYRLWRQEGLKVPRKTVRRRRLGGSDDFIDVLVDLFSIRGVPEFIRSDNGPELIARRVREFLESIDVGTSYIEPGSPWQNG